jgi:rhodanese-related sulfurtransferase
MRQRDVQVVDVREKNEWREGHIEGATHIPLGTLAARIAELDRDTPVITVCRSGHRSNVAAKQLLGAGFSDVANLEGGMIAWARSGLPVKR